MTKVFSITDDALRGRAMDKLLTSRTMQRHFQPHVLNQNPDRKQWAARPPAGPKTPTIGA